jgi:hypothetical protein
VKHLEYKELLTHSNDPEFRQQWQESAANEFGRLAQGIKGRVEYTDAIDFIHFHEKPKTKRLHMDALSALSDPRRKNKTGPASLSEAISSTTLEMSAHELLT